MNNGCRWVAVSKFKFKQSHALFDHCSQSIACRANSEVAAPMEKCTTTEASQLHFIDWRHDCHSCFNVALFSCTNLSDDSVGAVLLCVSLDRSLVCEPRNPIKCAISGCAVSKSCLWIIFTPAKAKRQNCAHSMNIQLEYEFGW